MTDQLERARELLQENALTKEDKEHLKNGVAQYLHELKEKGQCAFCQHAAFIKVDDSAVMVCTHCFKILEENLSSIKAFLGCK